MDEGGCLTTVRDLLCHLGVLRDSLDHQRQAIAGWLETNTPNGLLLGSLEGSSLLSKGDDA